MFRKKLPNKTLSSFFGLFLATLIWGAAGPIIKNTLEYIPPITFLFLRFLIACTVLLPYTIYEVQKVGINPKDYLNLFLLGVCSQSSLVLIFIGLKYTTSLDNAIIGLLGSILSVFAGYYFYKEKIKKEVRLGLLLSILGTIIVVIEPLFRQTRDIAIWERVFGNTLILINDFAWVLFIVWSKMSMGERSTLLRKTLSFIHIKPMTKEYPPTLITSISMFVGLFTIAPLALLESVGMFGPVQYFNISNIDVKGVLGLFYMALLSSIVAYVAYQKSLKNIKVSDAAFFGYLSPLFTFPVALIMLKEIPNTFVIVGSVAIAIGVFIAEKYNGEDR